METQRQIKYGKQIQKDLAEIFQKNPSYYFGNSLGTITRVNVSADLGVAKIYISVFPIDYAQKIFDNLLNIKNEIRRDVGKKMAKRSRKVPEIIFFHDDIEEKAVYMDDLISRLDIP